MGAMGPGFVDGVYTGCVGGGSATQRAGQGMDVEVCEEVIRKGVTARWPGGGCGGAGVGGWTCFVIERFNSWPPTVVQPRHVPRARCVYSTVRVTRQQSTAALQQQRCCSRWPRLVAQLTPASATSCYTSHHAAPALAGHRRAPGLVWRSLPVTEASAGQPASSTQDVEHQENAVPPSARIQAATLRMSCGTSSAGRKRPATHATQADSTWTARAARVSTYAAQAQLPRATRMRVQPSTESFDRKDA